jgi:hypothetical protein
MKVSKESADKIEKYGYMRSFTPDELVDMKDNLSTESIERSELEDEMKRLTAEIRTKIKLKKEMIADLLHKLKHKAEFVNEECYVEFDQKTGMATYFNSEGENVGRRPLTEAERQTTIFTEQRKNGTIDK